MLRKAVRKAVTYFPVRSNYVLGFCWVFLFLMLEMRSLYTNLLSSALTMTIASLGSIGNLLVETVKCSF